MKKIAILFDNNPMNKKSGIQVHCENLAELLNETEMFSASLCNDFEYFPIRFFRKSIYKPKSIEKFISDIAPDYINVHGFMSMLPILVISIARKKRIPVIYTPCMHPFYTLKHPVIGKISFLLLLKPILKYFSKIVVINSEEYRFFIKYNQNCCVISPWINKSYLPRNKNKHKLNKLLFVGRNEPNKNLSFLYNLPRNRFTVNCATDKKPNRDDFVFHANINDEELEFLYDSVSLVIIPSCYESFSFVALEALSHGTPILISNRVRIADHLNGVSGFTIFQYNDITDFQNKLEIALRTVVDVNKIDTIFSKKRAVECYKKLFH